MRKRQFQRLTKRMIKRVERELTEEIKKAIRALNKAEKWNPEFKAESSAHYLSSILIKLVGREAFDSVQWKRWDKEDWKELREIIKNNI